MSCSTCQHSWPLHGPGGCSVPSCDCREEAPPDVTPVVDLPPMRPGACVHGPDGSMHVVEDCEAITEAVNGHEHWVHFTCLSFIDGKQYTFEEWVRVEAIMRYHQIPEARWERMLKDHVG